MTKHYEPFDLERALSGDPVILRSGAKEYVRHHETTLGASELQQLSGYFHPIGLPDSSNKVIQTTWSDYGKSFTIRSEQPLDIVGMYPELAPEED